jgi:hypothetical protein
LSLYIGHIRKGVPSCKDMPLNETQQLSIPQRFREPAFRRYEEIIAKVVTTFPACLILDPKSLTYRSLSIETVTCRLRDAISSYERFRWPTSKFTDAQFDHARRNGLVVSQHIDRGLVLVGNRETIKAASVDPVVPAIVESPVADTSPLEHNILIKSYAELEHLASLCAERVISRPLILTLDNSEWGVKIVTSFDVEVEPTEKHNTIILT